MTTTDSPPPVCPRCGASLPSDAPEGLCPRCLAAVNFETGSLLTAAGVSLPPPPVEEIAPHFPQLEILSCLGRGGMGVVYKARQISLDRLVALKLLAPEREKDPEFSDRFAREAQALARMNHPHIVTVHDFGQAGGFFYLLMEYVDGANLRQLLQSHKFTPEQALAVVPPLCEALQYAHDRGIVHRDIKPENLLMDRDGKLKVADFGLVKLLGTTASGDERPVGTPAYMAPEQTGDPVNVDNRADIYSLGVVIYEMLTGELPGRNFQPPSSKPGVDPRLDEVVQRAMEQEPDKRFQQASILKTEVERISGIPAAETGPPALPQAGIAPPTNVSDEVRLPAIAMMIASGLAIAGQVFGVLVMLLVLVVPMGFMRGFPMHFDMPFGGSLFGGVTSLVILAVGGWMLVTLAMNVAVLIGANRMRKQESYQWSMAAAAILIICGVLSLPAFSLSLGGLTVIAQLAAGIWALVVLLRDGVKARFGNPPAAEKPVSSLPPPPDGVLKRKLTIPAFGLMATAGINLILLGLFLIIVILKLASPGHGIMPVWPVFIFPLIAIPSLITLFGAWRMREMKGYALAILAAVLALVTPPGLLIGVIFGIWALVVLFDKDVKAGFRSGDPNPSGKGILTASLVAAAVLLLLLVSVFLIAVFSARVANRHVVNVSPEVFQQDEVPQFPNPPVIIPPPPAYQPSIPPSPTPVDGSAADLAARFAASQTIRDFTVRDSALASIAKDAAASGNAAIAKQALQTMTDFTVRDDARKEVALLLSDRGMRGEALTVAKQITDFTKRDEVLVELATRRPGLKPEAEEAH